MTFDMNDVEPPGFSRPAAQPHARRRYKESMQHALRHKWEKTMTKKPHEGTRLANYVSRRILELKPRKTQSEIAAQAGYINPNVITMIKQGSNKAALDRIPALARALEVDPAYLMGLALEQAIGRTASEAVIEIFGDPVTENELGWIKAVREASGHSDPRLTTRSRAALNSIFGR